LVVVALVLSAGAAASWAIVNGASSVAPTARMDNSVARDLCAASRRNLLDALDTYMPPLYRKCLRSEFNNRLLEFFWSVAGSRIQARAVFPIVAAGPHVSTSHAMSRHE
jgi:hypothetical protein